jgi:toxin secretion/phage lysis holin
MREMMNVINTMQLGLVAVGGFIGWFVGGFDGFMYALLVFVVIDYISGVMVAVVDRQLSSEIGFRGIFKKVLIFALVGIGNIVDVYLIKNGSAIRTAIIFFYISNEGISFLENVGKIGLPIPEKLKSILKQLDKEDS